MIYQKSEQDRNTQQNKKGPFGGQSKLYTPIRESSVLLFQLSTPKQAL